LPLPRLPVESAKELDVVGPISGSAGSRQILPDQVKWAELLENEHSLPPGPSWKKQHRPQVTIVVTDGPEFASLTSAVLGSDIIRTNYVEAACPAPTSSVGTVISAFSPISRDSQSSRQVSFIVPYSFAPSGETLEILHEGNVTYPKGRPRPVSREPTLERNNTFGSRPPPLKRVSSEVCPPPVPALPYLASPPGLSTRVRHPPTPCGPRPLTTSESQRSPPLSGYRHRA